MTLPILGQAEHGVYLAQCAVQLLGVLGVGYLQQAVARGARQHLAVTALQKARYVAADDVPAQVLHLNVAELLAVVGLQRAVHAVPPVGVQLARPPLLVFFLYNVELVAVVLVQPVAGDHPDEAVAVLIHLVGEAARQLLVGIKQLARLCLDGHGSGKEQQSQRS